MTQQELLSFQTPLVILKKQFFPSKNVKQTKKQTNKQKIRDCNLSSIKLYGKNEKKRSNIENLWGTHFVPL